MNNYIIILIRMNNYIIILIRMNNYIIILIRMNNYIKNSNEDEFYLIQNHST
jgi:hypothetical protein